MEQGMFLFKAEGWRKAVSKVSGSFERARTDEP